MTVTPRTPPGVLELLPPQQLAFQRMLDTIRRGFELFGYMPIETPAFELTSVLLTKTGGETEKQVYFVQSTGAMEQGKAPEMALRFDLTVPLARYVAEHEAKLTFPFRRYQIQRVYRGERNQKGRYREFYQCDIDVIGKDTLPIEIDAEIPALIFRVLESLSIGSFTIYINNRKLLRGVLLGIGIAAEQHVAVMHELDRLGKQDRAAIEPLIVAHGVDADAARRLLDLVTIADPIATLAALDALAFDSDAFRTGLAELRQVYALATELSVPPSRLQIRLSIVRGLDYYTGTVYETLLDDNPGLGSICSGGRYDDLAGHYTKSKLPGVGISIGITRLLSSLLERDALAKEPVARVLVLAYDANARAHDRALAERLRDAGIPTETYPSYDKFGKQMKYADRTGVPLVVWTPSADATVVKLKDMRVTGDRAPELEVPRDELVAKVQSLLQR